MSDSFSVLCDDKFFAQFVPSRNKKDIIVSASSMVYVSTEMSGGSYSNYSKLRLDTREPLKVDHGGSFPAFRRGENAIAENEIMLQTGMFCGKEMSPKLYLNPVDFEKYRPRKKCIHNHPDCLGDANLSELCANNMPYLTPRRESILRIYSLTGKYKSEAMRNQKVLGEEIQQLIEMGYLEKKGSGVGKTLQAKNYKFSDGGY